MLLFFVLPLFVNNIVLIKIQSEHLFFFFFEKIKNCIFAASMLLQSGNVFFNKMTAICVE